MGVFLYKEIDDQNMARRLLVWSEYNLFFIGFASMNLRFELSIQRLFLV